MNLSIIFACIVLVDSSISFPSVSCLTCHSSYRFHPSHLASATVRFREVSRHDWHVPLNNASALKCPQVCGHSCRPVGTPQAVWWHSYISLRALRQQIVDTPPSLWGTLPAACSRASAGESLSWPRKPWSYPISSGISPPVSPNPFGIHDHQSRFSLCLENIIKELKIRIQSVFQIINHSNMMANRYNLVHQGLEDQFRDLIKGQQKLRSRQHSWGKSLDSRRWSIVKSEASTHWVANNPFNLALYHTLVLNLPSMCVASDHFICC